jgi:hypothetical protein
MPLADTSHTERIRRLRESTLAIFRYQNPTVKEQGVGGGVDESTRMSRALGQRTYTRQNENGSTEEEKPCGCDQ